MLWVVGIGLCAHACTYINLGICLLLSDWMPGHSWKPHTVTISPADSHAPRSQLLPPLSRYLQLSMSFEVNLNNYLQVVFTKQLHNNLD